MTNPSPTNPSLADLIRTVGRGRWRLGVIDGYKELAKHFANLSGAAYAAGQDVEAEVGRAVSDDIRRMARHKQEYYDAEVAPELDAALERLGEICKEGERHETTIKLQSR